MTAVIGQPAPAFELADQEGNQVSLESLLGRKTLVKFIPFPFTGICEGELCDLRDNLSQLNAMDANVVVITCDTRPANAKWSSDNGFEFKILSDFWPHGEVAQAYGCFNDTIGVAMRATYVLDAQGIVHEIIATDSLREPRSIASYHESLAALDRPDPGFDA